MKKILLGLLILAWIPCQAFATSEINIVASTASLTFGGSLTLKGTNTLSGTNTFNNPVIINSTLSVSGEAVFTSSATFTGRVEVSSSVTVVGRVTATAGLYSSGAVSLYSRTEAELKLLDLLAVPVGSVYYDSTNYASVISTGTGRGAFGLITGGAGAPATPTGW